MSPKPTKPATKPKQIKKKKREATKPCYNETVNRVWGTALCLGSPGREQGSISFLHPAKCKTTFTLVLVVIVGAIRGWWRISGWGSSLMRSKGIWATIPDHHCTLGYELRSFCLLLVENPNSLLHLTDTSQGYTWWEL